jgi:glycosyltransferase involved in cell wall biosynthesis
MNQLLEPPLVTVFMPVYNAGKYLKEAIASILNQTYKNFEFLIVNDGSTDDSLATIKSFNDKRIRLIENESNIGLIASLNIGLIESKGAYIVRMDQDDISLSHRIETQINFLIKNPEYGLIGSWFEDFGENIPNKIVKYSSNDTEIRIRHLYQTHISHPTAVIKKEIIDKYNLEFDSLRVHGEDYDFWVRISQYCKMSNFPELLVRKRDHPKNITNHYSKSMSETCTKVKQLQFRKMGVELNQIQTDLYTRFADPEWHFSDAELNILEEMLNNIIRANDLSAFVPVDEFRRYVSEKWFHLCYHNNKIKNQGFNRFHRAPFSKYYNLNTVSKLKFRIKSAISK